MADIDELELTRSEAPAVAPAPSPDRGKWIALLFALLAVGGWLGYSIFERLRPAGPPAAEAAAPAPATTPAEPASLMPRIEAEKIDLPPLAETDPVVRMLVGRLSGQPKVLAWLASNGLIENFTVVTLNIAEGKSPVAQLRPLLPQGPFRVMTTRGRMVVDPASYARYDSHATAIGALDATGAARLYLTLKPRIVDAYRQLGHPDGDFDGVLERALGVLLAVPIVEVDLPVREKVVTYEYLDAKTEALSPAARQLLRMGPGNMRTVQAKLREIANLLGITPRSPATT